MPARRDLTPAQALERIERKRAADREAARRSRARRRDVGLTGRSDAQARQADAAPEAGPVSVTPSQTLPVLSSSKELEKVRAILEPFATRGYAHSARFWHLAAEQYPLLCLELEALKVADWLHEPRNAKRKCNTAFLSNWLSKADVDRQQRNAQAAQLRTITYPPPPPAGPGKPPDPDPVLPADVVLQRIDPAVAQRALLEARRLTLPEKLALAKNGKH